MSQSLIWPVATALPLVLGDWGAPAGRCAGHGAFAADIFNKLFKIDNRARNKVLLADWRSC